MVNLLKTKSVRLFIYIILGILAFNFMASIAFGATLPTVENTETWTPTCPGGAVGFYLYNYDPIDIGYMDEFGIVVSPDPFYEYTMACNAPLTLDTLGTYEIGYCASFSAGVGTPCAVGAGSDEVLVILGVQIVPFDFLGDNFTSTVMSSVTGGVQDTTQPLVPVAGAMLGVPLAFVIARRVVGIIRLMV